MLPWRGLVHAARPRRAGQSPLLSNGSCLEGRESPALCCREHHRCSPICKAIEREWEPQAKEMLVFLQNKPLMRIMARAPLRWRSLWRDAGSLSPARELSHGEGKLEVTLQTPLWSNVLRKSLTGRLQQPVLSEDDLHSCHGSVSPLALGGRAHPSSRRRMPGSLLEYSQVTLPTALHSGAHYRSTMVGLGLGRGCRISAVTTAQTGLVTTTPCPMLALHLAIFF